ncbi:c-type cytochrome [Noviherbaspirillum sedimenti]|uniref:Cytochrome c4 n=1 Tax=Noviherbaspirillum sedimenti TaxID=2320865 RepID=A0A3A3FXY4_9BURK|nr:c-type cytochrome [Noviherbaspirillum sedimenti]RJG01053.1 cytochrome c4 [Noviherbaspirillum sedimenti]
MKKIFPLLNCFIFACAFAISGGVAIAQPAIPDTIAQRALACAACHGKEGRATSEGFFPRIAGKPAGYLYNQLVNFRDGQRQYPMMTYMVDQMSDAYLKELADYFASQHLPYPPPQAVNVSKEEMERGRQLVLSGDAAKKVPACVACHGQKLTGVAPTIPGLLGLPRDYLNAQFGAWRNKTRRTAAPDCMAEITSRLTPADVSAASAWLASQPVPANSTPAASLPVKLPLPCGSAHGVIVSGNAAQQAGRQP